MSKKQTEELLNESKPKRIYNWQRSQLSIARFYGGCKVNGVEYVIRYDVEGEPLEEVMMAKRRRKARAAIAKAEGEGL